MKQVGCVSELGTIPINNPVLISPIGRIVIKIRKLQGVCLHLEPKKLSKYDWSFAKGREWYVLYSKIDHFELALKIGRFLQFNGANTVILLVTNLGIVYEC